MTDYLDSLSAMMPSIKQPTSPLSIREKMKWTFGIIAVYFLLYNTYAYGINQHSVTQPGQELVSIIFASKVGSLITVGIGPIVLAGMVLQLLTGSGIINMDTNDPSQRSRYQALQKGSAIGLAIIESVVFVLTGYVPAASPGLVGIVMLQLAFGAITVILLDEAMTKYGITSGINLFIASGVSLSIVAGTFNVLLPQAIDAVQGGGAAAISNALIAFGPLLASVIVFLASIYSYGMKVELPLSFEHARGVGGRFPLPFLYVSVLPVILATSLILSLNVLLRFLANVHGALEGLAKFVVLYQAGPNGVLQPAGGLVYLISPSFPLPYSAALGGIGGYGPYFVYLMGHATQLFLPWGGFVWVPEWAHMITYAATLVTLCVVFGSFWIEFTGQSPQQMAEQLGEMGWQIPGFRRDPRIIEHILKKYIPTLTVLGSVFVALLAAVATFTGAIGTGMGILLTVGIIYMLYQQLENERIFDAYPVLRRIAK